MGDAVVERSHLARLELRTAVDELHRRSGPYAITPGEVPRYNHAGVRAAEYLPLSFAPSRRPLTTP